MSISDRFCEKTLTSIINKLPEEEKDINDYREVRVYSKLKHHVIHNDDVMCHKYDLVGKEIAIIASVQLVTEGDIQKYITSIPEHKAECLCGQWMKKHYWIRHTKTDILQLIGSCCIQKFMEFKGTACKQCNTPHNNRVSNYCTLCRKGCHICYEYHKDNSVCKTNPSDYKMKFGVHRGKYLKDVPKSYIQWMKRLDNKGEHILEALEYFQQL